MMVLFIEVGKSKEKHYGASVAFALAPLASLLVPPMLAVEAFAFAAAAAAAVAVAPIALAFSCSARSRSYRGKSVQGALFHIRVKDNVRI